MRLREAPLNVVVSVLLATGLVGCSDRYEIAQDKQGRTIRLDKRTGEVAILSDDGLIIVKNEQQQAAEETAKSIKERALAELRAWPAQDFKTIGVETGTLFTAWRDGTLRYQLQLNPIPKGYDHSYTPTPLTLKLSDRSGFVVVEIEFKRSDLIQVVDDNGKLYALSANASVKCPRKDYESLSAWSLSWQF